MKYQLHVSGWQCKVRSIVRYDLPSAKVSFHPGVQSNILVRVLTTHGKNTKATKNVQHLGQVSGSRASLDDRAEHSSLAKIDPFVHRDADSRFRFTVQVELATNASTTAA